MDRTSSAAAQLATLPMASVDLSRGAKAAREFEAQLIASLLQSFEKTFASLPGQTDLPGADDYNVLGTQALASAIAEHGGFGIAKMIVEHLPASHESKGLVGDSSPDTHPPDDKVPVSPADRMK